MPLLLPAFFRWLPKRERGTTIWVLEVRVVPVRVAAVPLVAVRVAAVLVAVAVAINFKTKFVS